MLKAQPAFSRHGPLTAWVVIWLMIFQRLCAKGTLSAAVLELSTGSLQAHLCWPKGQTGSLSANTSAYSQARSRLPLQVAEAVSDRMFESLFQTAKAKTVPGLDRPLFLLDGTSLRLQHTSELAKAYPPAPNQHGVSHWPILRVLVAHEVMSGLAVRPCWGPMYGESAVSEQGLTKDLLPRLPAEGGVLADRNFGVFSVAYHARQGNRPCLLRLTEARAKKLNGGVVAPNAGTDKRVGWVPSREDLRNNPEIPADAAPVEGRLLAFTIDQGGKPEKVYLFTTLELPAEEILRLYGYRWRIETDLGTLKREVRLHLNFSKSKAMVEKELVLAVAAYNLTRGAMNEAASALGLEARQLSYSRAQDTLNAFLPVLANAASEQEREVCVQRMLRVFSQSKLPRRRKRRSYPREVWTRPSAFPRRKITKRTEVAKPGNTEEKTIA